MPKGGARLGAGRKPGSVSKKTREIADAAAAQGITPIEVLLATMRLAWARSKEGEVHGEDLMLALDCATRAMAYVHPRMQAISVDANIESKGEQRLVVFWGGDRSRPGGEAEAGAGGEAAISGNEPQFGRWN